MSAAPVLYPADWAARMTPGASYRPANGTEGELFAEAWCAGCARWEGGGCPIWLSAVMCSIGDGGYPPELVYDRRGQPSCSARASGEAERCPATPDLFS